MKRLGLGGCENRASGVVGRKDQGRFSNPFGLLRGSKSADSRFHALQKVCRLLPIYLSIYLSISNYLYTSVYRYRSFRTFHLAFHPSIYRSVQRAIYPIQLSNYTHMHIDVCATQRNITTTHNSNGITSHNMAHHNKTQYNTIITY